jgi:hypothetical protein
MGRLTVIACSSLKPELELAVAGRQVSLRCLAMGLHQSSATTLHDALQSEIDAADGDAVVIAYGLCNGGIVGLKARGVPLVLPRAHDCIGLLLGTQRYRAELERAPDTYFQSAGWLAAGETRQPEFTFGPNTNVTREALIARYGEDNADYLLEQFDGFTRHYDRLAFIATVEEPVWQRKAEALAADRGWRFERLPADLGWLRALIDGPWDGEDFLIVRPGECVVRTGDEQLIGAVPQ